METSSKKLKGHKPETMRKLWFAWLVQQFRFFFSQRHKPDLCPGVYPKLMVVFAALGIYWLSFLPEIPWLCKWFGRNMHRGLGVLRPGSSLRSWSLGISCCGSTSSVTVGLWSGCWFIQRAANGALRKTFTLPPLQPPGFVALQKEADLMKPDPPLRAAAGRSALPRWCCPCEAPTQSAQGINSTWGCCITKLS